jgi:DNA-directed RNA polymerase subunit K/omega
MNQGHSKKVSIAETFSAAGPIIVGGNDSSIQDTEILDTGDENDDDTDYDNDNEIDIDVENEGDEDEPEIKYSVNEDDAIDTIEPTETAGIYTNDGNEEPSESMDKPKCLYKYTKNETYNEDSDNATDINDDFLLDDIPDDPNVSFNEKYLYGDDRISEPVMTKYEYVRICGIRAKQIELTAKKFVKNVGNLDSKEIAMLELKYRMSPCIIKRPIAHNLYELWKIKELEIPNLFEKEQIN